MALTSEVADLYVILRAVTAPFTEAMGKAGVEGEAAGSKISGSMGKISPIIMAIGAATAIGAAASIKWATDFETQYTRLYTAAGASKDQVLANRDAMLQLGSATGYTGTQIAEAMYHPISTGLSLAQSLEVVKYSAEEARISGAKLDDTTFALSSVMKSFNVGTNDAGKTMALLNAIVGDGDMHFQTFNTSVKNWAPTAAQMGISIQSMGSALAYLTDRGNSAEEASTRVTMGLTMMSTPSKQAAKMLEGLGLASTDVTASSSAMAEVLKKTGITQNQLAVDLSKPDGIYVALSRVKTALEAAGVSGTEADSVLSKIFGGGRSDKAILSLMQNLDGLKAKYDQIGRDSTAKQFEQDWQDAQKTTAVQFDKLKATVINLGIQLGGKLLPIVKDLMKWFSDGISYITQHREAMMALAAILTGVVAVAIAGVTIALWGMVAPLLANPIVDIIAAIAMGAVYVATHWKQVKKFFEDFWSWIKDHTQFLKPVIDAVRPIVKEIGDGVDYIITHWKGIVGFFVDIGKQLIQWGKDQITFFSHMWDDLSSWFTTAWKVQIAAVKLIWEGLKTAWQDVVRFFERVWNDTGGKLVHEISQDWQSVSTAVSKEWKIVSADLSSIWQSLTTIWDSTGGKLVHYIADAFGWVSDEIDKHWTFIKANMQLVWDQISKVIQTVLTVIMTVIRVAWDTISAVTKAAWDVVWGVIKAAWDLIFGIVKGALLFIGGLLQAAWDGAKLGVKTAWDLITGIFNTVLDSIKNVFKLFADFFSGHWSRLWQDVKDIFSGLWNDTYTLLKNVFLDMYNFVVKTVGDIWNGFVNGCASALAGIGRALLDIKNTVFNFFSNAGTWLLQIGKDIVNGLINGVKSMASSAVDTVKGVGNDIISGFKSVLSILSPSRVFHDLGENVGKGLINGITAQTDNVREAAKKMAKAVTEAKDGLESDLNVSGSLQAVTAAFDITGTGADNTKLFTSGPSSVQPVVNVTVQGSVLSDRDLRDVVQEQMLRLGARYSTSYTPYERQ